MWGVCGGDQACSPHPQPPLRDSLFIFQLQIPCCNRDHLPLASMQCVFSCMPFNLTLAAPREGRISFRNMETASERLTC